MDSSSKSLLDLLNKSSSATKKSSDKDELLALFGQKPLQSPAAAVDSKAAASPGNNRNSNANDLLAALMGSSTPKQSEADSSAALLSSLMGSAKSAYSSNGSNVPAPNYLNPRHESLLQKTPSRPLSPEMAARPQTKAFFDNSNPFDELERFHVERRMQPAPTGAQIRAETGKTSPVTQHKKTPSPQTIHVSALEKSLSKSPVQERSSKAVSQNANEDKKVVEPAPASVAQIQPAASKGAMPRPSASIEVEAVAVSLPSENSSILKLTGSKLSAAELPQLKPITKMGIKADPVNRNIVAASYRYIAYPVTKDGTSGHIRIVDQDTGEVALLSQHSSKVVSVAFAMSADADGKNAFISVDVDSNVIVWSINSASQIDKVFEIAGPSDTSHKARTVWNANGTYFGVSITSRLYIFDYRSLVAGVGSSKVKLNPEMRQALCICKADKAIRGFAFSLDSTSLAAIDKAGNIKFWILESSGKNMSAAGTIVLGEKNLSSIHFVGQRHIVVGSSASSSLIIVDLAAGKAAQELRLPLPGSKDVVTTHKVVYIPKRETIIVQQAFTKSLFLVHVNVASKESQNTSTVIANMSMQTSHQEATGNFNVVSAFTCMDDSIGEWLDLEAVSDSEANTIVLAHTKGYSMSSIEHTLLQKLSSEGQRLDASLVTKMPTLGRVVIEEEQPANEETNKTFVSQPEVEKTPGSTTKQAKKLSKPSEQQAAPSLVTEPRTAEMAARIEANLRTSITNELQKGNASITAQVDKMQKASDSKHETVLRLISETLSKNTTQVLQAAINDAVEKSVLPTINKTVHTAVATYMEKNLPAMLEGVMTGTLADSVHSAVQKAFDSAGLVAQLETAASTMTTDLGTRHKHMEQSLAGALVRLDAQILERQTADSEKIEKLLQAVTALERQVADLKTASQALQVPVQVTHPPPPTFNHIQAPSYPQHQSQAPPVQAAASPEDFTKYHELIMNFVSKSQKISGGDFEGVAFVRQFLSWQPEHRVKDNICKSLAADQLQILAFVHALASELGTEDAYNRVHWIASALRFLRTGQDVRLTTLGPQLLTVIQSNLSKALERAPNGSEFRHLLDAVLTQMATLR